MKIAWIKVMADYSSSGLWNGCGMIDEGSLDLPQWLEELLHIWTGWYEDGSMELALEKKPLPPHAEQFNEIGMFIARELKRCQPKLEVSYWDESMKPAPPMIIQKQKI